MSSGAALYRQLPGIIFYVGFWRGKQMEYICLSPSVAISDGRNTYVKPAWSETLSVDDACRLVGFKLLSLSPS